MYGGIPASRSTDILLWRLEPYAYRIPQNRMYVNGAVFDLVEVDSTEGQKGNLCGFPQELYERMVLFLLKTFRKMLKSCEHRSDFREI